MANSILHATIIEKNASGDKTIIYPKNTTKDVLDGSQTLEQTLNTLKSNDISNKTTAFTQVSTRQNLTSGETIATSHGKIMKLISDLKSLAFLDKVGVANLDGTLTTEYDGTLTTEYNKRITTDKVTTSTSITSAGYVADARAINSLQNQINTLNSKTDILNKNIASDYWCFKYGTVIYANEDLNNIVKFGNYYCQVNVNAETLKNCPTKDAFTMKVYSSVGSGADNYIAQELTTYKGRKFLRCCGGDKVWGNWGKIVLNSDLKTHYYNYEYNGGDKEYAIQDIFYKLPADSSNHLVTVACGNLFSLIIHKYSDHSWGSILRFGYADRLTQYRIVSNTWYKSSLNFTESQIDKLI